MNPINISTPSLISTAGAVNFCNKYFHESFEKSDLSCKADISSVLNKIMIMNHNTQIMKIIDGGMKVFFLT